MDFRAPVHVRRRSQLDTERNMLEGLRAEMKASGDFSDDLLATTSTRVARELPMRFCYTIILRNPEVPKVLMPTLRSLQEKVVMSLLRLNLEVKILATTELTERKLVILVSAESENDELLHRESYRLDCERYLKFGTGAVPQSEFDAAVKQPLSPAMKLYLTWLMVERALKFVHLKDFEVREKALADSVVAAHVSSVPSWKRSLGLQTCGLKQFRTIATRFALHDLVFNEKFMHDIVRRPYSKVLDLSDATKQLYDQFGARVAIYFSFVSSYTQMLAPLALFSVLFYLVVRIADWQWYVRLLAVLGICVPAIWAPIVLNRWEAKSKQLAFDWKLENLPDKAVPNDRDPESEMRYDEELDFHWKQYDPKNHRKKVTSCLIPFAIINLLILIIAMTPFVQWYVFGKLSPTCDCCNWFLDNPMESRAANVTVPAECVVFDRDPEGVGYKEIETCSYFVTCFSSLGSTVGTDRWVYILIQGILLGIALDVVQFELFVAFTVFLTDKESWASENEYERNLIRKQFLFLWVNMYFWFLFIAFVYVPFGDVVQDILQELGFEAFVPGSGWRNGVINLDEAFVTPLVVTQAVNLLLETGVPYLGIKVKKAVNKPMKMASHAVDGWTSSGAPAKGSTRMLHHGSSRIIRVNAVELDRSMLSGARLHRIIEGMQKNNLLPDGPIDIFQETPDPDLLHADEGEENANHYTFGEVLTQGRLGDWDSRDDFLDTLMQFGYVLMFTIAWSLAPITALVNNVIEIRFDSFKLLYNNRRPLPLEDQGIGEWANALNSSVAYALPVVAGLVVIGTGQLEFWRFGTCQERFYQQDVEAMDPDLDCFDSWGIRLLVGVVIERIAVSVVFLIRKIPKISKETQAELDKIETEQRRRIQDSLLPTLPPGLKQNLWVIFRHFDADGNGILSMTELPGVLDRLKKGEKLKPQYMKMFLSFVDVDASATVTFAEFALALKRAQDDFVLNEVLDIANLAEQAKKLADQIREGGDVGKGSGQGSSDQLMDMEETDYA